jgi:hypothetical protein
VTFRVSYDLDTASWKIEVGDPNSLVFGSAEEMADWEEQKEKERNRFTKSSDKAQAETESRFTDLSYPGIETSASLPGNSAFGWVYTPQYSEVQRPSEDAPEEGDAHTVVYTYVYPNGTADYTVIRIVDADDPEDGYTVIIEPMSGQTDVIAEEIDPLARMSWVPLEAPTIR